MLLIMLAILDNLWLPFQMRTVMLSHWGCTWWRTWGQTRWPSTGSHTLTVSSGSCCSRRTRESPREWERFVSCHVYYCRTETITRLPSFCRRLSNISSNSHLFLIISQDWCMLLQFHSKNSFPVGSNAVCLRICFVACIMVTIVLNKVAHSARPIYKFQKVTWLYAVRLFGCSGVCYLPVRFGQLLRRAHKRIVNIMKVYIERNNMQSSDSMFTAYPLDGSMHRLTALKVNILQK